MSELVNRIEWGEPILPAVPDPTWEAVVKRKMGKVPGLCRRVIPSPWLRETCLAFESYTVTEVSPRLMQIGAMVTSQENACRYCYGATRAYLRMLGYSESKIARMERDAQLAELDSKERTFIEFCRGLARSRPRPARAERERLLAHGFAPRAVTELAFMVAMGCMYNRIATFVACPPEVEFERFVYGPMGMLLSLLGPVLRPILLRSKRPDAAALAVVPSDGMFETIVSCLEGLPAAGVLQRALADAFASPVLRRRTKGLMFAVVARSLECGVCEREAGLVAVADGLTTAQVETALAEFDGPFLERSEAEILNWVRDTVHYEPASIQKRTRALGERIGPDAMLEAIGIASLANATVRLAMLLE